MRGVRRFTELRAWQACDSYKKAIYRLCEEGPLSRDDDRRRQLEKSVKGPPAHVAEGFGRFNPTDFARFTVIARASLMESQNHLRDAVDMRYISEEVRLEFDKLAVTALEEVTGLMEYLQSPEALRNARRARERRIASRRERRNHELRTDEPGTDELGTDEPGTGEPGTGELRTNEPRTTNKEPRTEP
jgi:four helix bundle protein